MSDSENSQNESEPEVTLENEGQEPSNVTADTPQADNVDIDSSSSPSPVGKNKNKEPSSLTSMKETVMDKLGETTEYAKNPQKLAPAMKTTLNNTLPQATLKIFLALWFPFVIMAAGTVLGLAFRLVTRGFHYFIGMGAAFYVYQVVNSETHSLQEKSRVSILIAAVVPVLMLDETYWFFKLAAIIAFCGTPFAINTYLQKDEEKHSKDKEWQDTLLQYSTAPAVIFAIATGGVGFFNALSICLVFGGACFAALSLVEPVTAAIPHPLAAKHKEIVYVALQLKLANILMWLLQWIILPVSIVEEQNSLLVQIFYTIMGIALLVGGQLLHTGEFLSGIDSKVINTAKQGFTYTVAGAYVLLLLDHVIKQWLYSYLLGCVY